jgi:hypothetical protein
VGWCGVESGAERGTNGVIRGGRAARNGAIRDAETAVRPLAPGPLVQSKQTVAGPKMSSQEACCRPGEAPFAPYRAA